MKKTFKLLTIALVLSLVLMGLVGCNLVEKVLNGIGRTEQDTPPATTLAIPIVTLSDGHILSWKAIDGASGYVIKYEDKLGNVHLVNVTGTMYDTDELGLDVGSYLFSVCAHDATAALGDSAYSKAQSVFIKQRMRLDVQPNVYYVTANTLLVQCTPLEGVKEYCVELGKTVFRSAEPTVLLTGVSAITDVTLLFYVEGDDTHDYGNATVSLPYVAASAEQLQTIDYDKADASLHLELASVTQVSIDGVQVNNASAVDLVLDGDTLLRKLGLGEHFLEVKHSADTSRYVLQVTDTRLPVLVNPKGDVVTEMDYQLARNDLYVYWHLYANSIIGVSIDGVAWTKDTQYTVTDSYLFLKRSAMSGLAEGDRTLTISYRTIKGASRSVELLLHCIAVQSLSYDKATGTSLNRTGLLMTTVAILGGGLSSNNYALRTDGDSVTATLTAGYLATLSAGTYTYLAVTDTRSDDETFLVDVYDSTCKPENVKLDYDTDRSMTYVRFTCDCGSDRHHYQLDGGGADLDSFGVALRNVDRNVAHTLSVTCLTNGTTSDAFVIDATSTGASAYVSKHYEFEDKTPDYFIASVDELAEFLRYLSYGASEGEFDSTYGDYGIARAKVFIAKGILSDEYQLSHFLKDALALFSAPTSGSSGLGDPQNPRVTLNSDYSGEVDAYFLYAAPLTKSESTGMATRKSSDPRPLLSEGTHTTYLEGVSTTRYVGSLAQLSLLPYGIRPQFEDSEDINIRHACDAYNAALTACRTYLRDDMTDYEKVEAIYDYLCTQVTYDDFALVLFNLDDKAKEAEYYGDSSILYNYIQDCLNSDRYKGTAMETRMRSLQAMSFEDAKAYITESLNVTSFDAYGALVSKVAVCDGISDAVRLMCLIENIPCLKVMGYAKSGTSGERHAWNKVCIDDVWYIVDATWGRSTDPKHTYDCVSHRYCMVSDADVRANHFENGSMAADATVQTVAAATHYDYYAMTILYGKDMVIDDWDDFDATMTTLYAHKEEVPFVEMRFSFDAGQTTMDNHISSLGLNGVLRAVSGEYVMLWFK